MTTPTPDSKSKSQSWSKVVPWSILQADRESQLAYIAAYIEGDGRITRDGRSVIIVSRSVENLRLMQVLLASHGILSDISAEYPTLYLNAESSMNLCSAIDKYLVTKNALIDRSQWTDNSYKSHGVPLEAIADFVERRMIRPPATGKGGGVFQDDNDCAVEVPRAGADLLWPLQLRKTMLYGSYQRGLYDGFLSALRLVSRRQHDDTVELLKSRYYFDEVVSIEDAGVQDVYDLSMLRQFDPSFVGNGIIVHNSGESTYANFEQARSVFTEQIRQFRMFLTHQVYGRMFDTLARAHGFVKHSEAELRHGVRVNRNTLEPALPVDPGARTRISLKRYEQLVLEDIPQHEALQISSGDLIVPQVSWHKSLMPESDDALLQIYQSLKDQGIPIPLRMWAAAGGVDIDDIIDEMTSDAKLRKRIKEWEDWIESGPSSAELGTEGGPSGAELGLKPEEPEQEGEQPPASEEEATPSVETAPPEEPPGAAPASYQTARHRANGSSRVLGSYLKQKISRGESIASTDRNLLTGFGRRVR